MRRLIWAAISLGIFGLLGVVIFATWQDWTRAWSSAMGSPSAVKMVRIPAGASLSAVTDTLLAHDLLQHPTLFRLGARLTGQDRHLQAGRYAIPVGTSPRDLLDLLVTGRTLPVRVTLPEGIDVEAAATLVASALTCEPRHFLAAADSLAREAVHKNKLLGSAAEEAAYDSVLQHHPDPVIRNLHWAEGYLAPDTYHFAEGTSALAAAQTIVALGVARLDSAYRQRSARLDGLDLTPHKFLTLASIVEAEARLDEERAKIAAVYVNRLHQGWRLEADPCVAYLLKKRGQRLYYKDLAVNSPYNTYRQGGLPPGPIGCPGLRSLQAASEPDADHEIMFFVSDAEGGHVFSRTRKEHEAAVREFRNRRGRASR